MHIVAVGGLVVNEQGQILLLKSPRYGDWEFPGGQVEEGETLFQALKREILEETGVEVEVQSLVSVNSNTRKPPIVMMDFICKYVAGEPRSSSESAKVEWFSREEALSKINRPSIYKRLKNMLEFSGDITYRAFFVDPHQTKRKYIELEERKI